MNTPQRNRPKRSVQPRHKGAGPAPKACLGCKECTGMCWEMLELFSLPDLLLASPR